MLCCCVHGLVEAEESDILCFLFVLMFTHDHRGSCQLLQRATCLCLGLHRSSNRPAVLFLKKANIQLNVECIYWKEEKHLQGTKLPTLLNTTRPPRLCSIHRKILQDTPKIKIKQKKCIIMANCILNKLREAETKYTWRHQATFSSVQFHSFLPDGWAGAANISRWP